MFFSKPPKGIFATKTASEIPTPIIQYGADAGSINVNITAVTTAEKSYFSGFFRPNNKFPIISRPALSNIAKASMITTRIR